MRCEFDMTTVTPDERFRAAACHLSIVAGLVLGPLSILVPAFLWYDEKNKKDGGGSEFVIWHAAQAVIYQAVINIIGLLLGLLIFILMFIVVGLLLIPVAIIFGLAAFIYAIFVGVKVYQGENMQYFVVGAQVAQRL